MVGEEIGERETQLKRKLTPLEKSKVLEETAKLYVVNDGDRLPEFQRRMAERRGFIDVPGQGFVRKNADGPTQPYELPQLDEPDRPHPEPLQPLPEREGQGAQAPAPPRQKRPKMMLDGTPYTPPPPLRGPPLAGGAKEWGFGCPLLAGGAERERRASGDPDAPRREGAPDGKVRRLAGVQERQAQRRGLGGPRGDVHRGPVRAGGGVPGRKVGEEQGRRQHRHPRGEDARRQDRLAPDVPHAERERRPEEWGRGAAGGARRARRKHRHDLRPAEGRHHGVVSGQEERVSPGY